MRSVIDFSSLGPTRGLLDPPTHAGEVIRPRQPDVSVDLVCRIQNITPNELARRMEVSPRTIQRWRQQPARCLPGPVRVLLRRMLLES